VLESAFPTLATLVIFAAVGHAPSGQHGLDTGQFLAFYVAFGQSLSAMGELATAMAEQWG